MTKRLVLSLLFSVSILQLFAQNKNEIAVAKAVEALKAALLSGNAAEIGTVTSENLSYGHSGGKIETKAELIESFSSGKSDFVSIELTNQTILITGKTAVVRHQLRGETMDGGKPGSPKLYVLLVFIKEKGAWKLLARQAAKIV